MLQVPSVETVFGGHRWAAPPKGDHGGGWTAAPRRVICRTLLAGTIAALAGCRAEQALFNGRDLTGWTEVGSHGAWRAVDGELRCDGTRNGYAWLCSDRTWGDFELSLEWRIEKDGNSGVFLRVPDREGRASMKGLEIQARDDSADTDLSDVSGSVFRRIPAMGRFTRPVGQWNHLHVSMRGRRLTVRLNGHTTVDAEIDRIPARDGDPPMSAIPAAGYIGLQNHGTPVAFRRILLREY